MKRFLGTLVLLAFVAHPAAAATRTATMAATPGSRLPPPCAAPLGGCELELYRRGAVQQGKATEYRAKLEACEAKLSAAPPPSAVPAEIKIDSGVPKWVWPVIGIALLGGTIGAIYGVVKANEAADRVFR